MHREAHTHRVGEEYAYSEEDEKIGRIGKNEEKRFAGDVFSIGKLAPE